MSHFSVAVFHTADQSVDDLLAPYNENLEVEKYVRYTKQEAIARARELRSMKDASDDECWEYWAEDYEPEMIDEEGNLYSTYNPDSRWDWYEVGGRWNGLLEVNGMKKNSARLNDVQNLERILTFAVITRDGKWHAKGKMGWFGMSDATAEEELRWAENYQKQFMAGAEDDLFVTIVDCHI